MNRTSHRRYMVLFSVFAIALAAEAQTPLGAAFTYQGRLEEGGTSVNQSVNLVFTLWNDPAATAPANQVGNPIALATTPDADGLFTVQLNVAGEFGASAFNGQQRWLQVSVDGTPLVPRQEATLAPYSQFSQNTRGIVVDAGGNVGLGTTAPAAPFHVNRTGTPPAGLPPSQNGLLAGSQSASGYKWLQSYGGPLALNPLGNNVGIGTPSPAEPLDVAGTVRSSDGGFRFPDNSVQTTAAFRTGLESSSGVFTVPVPGPTVRVTTTQITAPRPGKILLMLTGHMRTGLHGATLHVTGSTGTPLLSTDRFNGESEISRQLVVAVNAGLVSYDLNVEPHYSLEAPPGVCTVTAALTLLFVPD